MPPAPEGCDDFLVTVHVKLHQPVYNVDDPAEVPVQGYYTVLGVRASASRLRDVVAQAVDDGTIEWRDTEWHVVEADSLDRAMRKRFTPVRGEGVWYRGGRILYADPELEIPPS